ncbi:MAG: hypothetical protein KAG53_01365 [Endozoicomonadaceae bacterium]|nr:hypothetical protein [Endozoicomonadaceae bacterium]
MNPSSTATSHLIEHRYFVESGGTTSNYIGKSAEKNIIEKKINKLQKEGCKFTVRKCSVTKEGKMEVKEELERSPAKTIWFNNENENENDDFFFRCFCFIISI